MQEPAPNPGKDHDVKVVQSTTLRIVLIVCGFLSLLVGLIGAVLPVLPTAPFVLLAAACFAKSSRRFYQWLAYNPYFGHYVRDFREHRRIPLKAKILATVMIVVSVTISIVFLIPVFAVKIGVAVVVLAVMAWIWSFPH